MAATIKERLASARERSPLLDHVVSTVLHFNAVGGSQSAGAVTYFGFLSVFPVLAISFFVIGYVARIWPDARDQLVTAINQVLPGIVGSGEHEMSLADVQDAAGTVGIIGLIGVLYAGLGWLSALQTALIAIFEEPKSMQPGFVAGKIRDLTTLVVLGVVLLAGVALSGVLIRLLPGGFAPVAVLAGIGAGTVLFFLMFQLLARPPVPSRALWSGALLGAVGFEILKQASSLLISMTRGQPAFQAFGIALILVVWINYFSKLVVFAGAWAYTSPSAIEQQAVGHGRQSERDALAGPPEAAARRTPEDEALQPAAAFALGGATMLGVVALARKTVRKGRR